MTTARATFAIDLQPPTTDLGDRANRHEFTKTWSGDIEGTGTGVMLSGGNPATGVAGYVAFEVIEGSVNGRSGTFALQQFGSMADGAQDLRYEVVPGSGTGELDGLRGTVQLTIEEDGTHAVLLEYVGVG